MSLASSLYFGTFSLSCLDVAKNFVKLSLINLRSLLRFITPRVTNDPLPGSLSCPLDKLVIDVLVNKSSGSRTTILSMIGKDGIMSDLYSFVNVNIRHDH